MSSSSQLAHNRDHVIEFAIGGRKAGQIVNTLGKKEYVTWRNPVTLYRNTPCKKHGRCHGFTVSREIINWLERQNCFLVRIEYKDEGIGVENYVTNLDKLKAAATTEDGFNRPQYSLPLHEWLKL